MENLKPLSKRAYTFIAVFFIILIAASFLASCGSDDIVYTGGNPPNNEQLIFSLDSFSIRTSFIGEQTLHRTDTIPVLFDSCKITFESVSNCDSQSSINLKVYDSLYIAFMRNINTFNQVYTTYDKAKLSSQLKIIDIILHIDNPVNAEKYILIKNFKVYKIN